MCNWIMPFCNSMYLIGNKSKTQNIKISSDIWRCHAQGFRVNRRIVLDRYGYQLEDNLVIETSKMYEQNDILIWVCLFVFAQISCSFNGDNSVMNGSDFNSTISGPSVIDFAWMFQLAAGIAQLWSGFAKCLIDIYWLFGRERRLNLIHWGGFMVCNRIGIGVMGGFLFDSSLASGSGETLSGYGETLSRICTDVGIGLYFRCII